MKIWTLVTYNSGGLVYTWVDSCTCSIGTICNVKVGQSSSVLSWVVVSYGPEMSRMEKRSVTPFSGSNQEGLDKGTGRSEVTRDNAAITPLIPDNRNFSLREWSDSLAVESTLLSDIPQYTVLAPAMRLLDWEQWGWATHKMTDSQQHTTQLT